MPRSGNGYAGIGTGSSLTDTTDNRREYIECKLKDTLIAGKKYCVEFYVSLGDSSVWAMDQIGAYLSPTMVMDMTTIDHLSYQPQIESPAGVPITDEIAWVKISGVITANGGETYITIGNFHPTSEVTADSMAGSWYWAYYFIDDVSVIETATCNAGSNTIICEKDSVQLGAPPVQGVTYSWQPTTGLSDPTIANPKSSPLSTTNYVLTQTQCDVMSRDSVLVNVKKDCNLSDSPFVPTILFGDQMLYITGLESFTRLEVYDARGRKVFAADDYTNNFGRDAAAGIYFVRITLPSGEVRIEKLCIVK